MAIESGDTVTIEYTGRLEDGTVFDTSRQTVAEEAGIAEAQQERSFDPLTIEVGEGSLIEGFEAALFGLEAGESTSTTIPPDEAYGEWDESLVTEYDVDEFQEMAGEVPTVGTFVETQRGDLAEITQVDEESVHVDFNHQLAGETLEFDIEIVDVE